MRWYPFRVLAFIFLVGALAIVLPSESGAHCDTMDGPVVAAARTALEKADITPVLMWVKEGHEKEIRSAFERTLAVRALGKEAGELADRYFFETVVRLHREGEGEPYSGLKPSGTDIHPLIKAADKAIEDGSVEKVIQHITRQVSDGIRKLFLDAVEKRRHAKESVQHGREYVESYVEFVHYVERLAEEAKGSTVHAYGEDSGTHAHGH